MAPSAGTFAATVIRFAGALLRRPLVALLGLGLVTVVLGTFALRLRIESSLESVLPRGDESVAYYDRIRALFGSDDVAVIGMRCDDLFRPETLAKIARVTDAVTKIEGVERVVSITNAVDVAADLVTPPRLLPRVPPTEGDIAALRATLEKRPLYRRNLVAEDGRGAAINVFLKPMDEARYAQLEVDRRIQDIMRAAEGPERFFYTGGMHLERTAVGMVRDDLIRFTPLALGLVVAVLWLSFRTRRGVFLPLMAVVTALIWTLGVMVLTGHSISIGTFVLPPLLLVVGSSYAIHVMARYYEQVDGGGPPTSIVLRAFERVWVPLSVSALVTVIGFASLMVNRIPAIWELGAFAVVGVLALATTTLIGIPATLVLMPPERGHGRAPRSTSLSNALGSLARAAYSKRRPILSVALIVALVAAVGMTFIRVDSDFLYYFKPGAPVRQHNEIINREVVGSNPFYVVLEGPPGMLRRWEVLKEIRDLQRFLESLPGVTSSISLVDYLELLESGLNKQTQTGGAGEDLVVDDAGNLVPASQVRTFWEDPKSLGPVLAAVASVPDTFKSVVTPDFSKASILVRTKLSGSRAIEGTLARIRAYIAAHFPAEQAVRLTGNVVLLSGTTSDIVTGQIESLSIALAVIFAVMALMFLSVRIALLAIVPNLLPILVFFGVMGWVGILLNLGTSLIAAIALGIAVDSTIHYMARLNFELRGETNQEAAIGRALRTVGVPIVFTTVALFFGFLTFAFSSFVPIQNFGVLSGVTMLGSLGANLVLLPTLLATTPIITLWDLLRVELGEDPSSTIPLFAGLRRTQARVVVLMGRLERYQPGQPIVHAGDQGDEMYIVIRGRARVLAPGGGPRRHLLAEITRGDVFGEMGLVRRIERNADVVADSDVEVLAVDQNVLQRLQRRYPRIASKVFLNLTRILSDRLERANKRVVAAQAG